MSISVNVNGFVVECSDPADVIEIIKAFSRNGHKPATTGIALTPAPVPRSVGLKPPNTLAETLAIVKSREQRSVALAAEFLEVLIAHPQGIKTEELIVSLRIKTAKGVGSSIRGVWSTIAATTRMAQAEVFTKSPKGAHGSRTWWPGPRAAEALSVIKKLV